LSEITEIEASGASGGFSWVERGAFQQQRFNEKLWKFLLTKLLTRF
jgi:hypothetical protein